MVNYQKTEEAFKAAPANYQKTEEAFKAAPQKSDGT